MSRIDPGIRVSLLLLLSCTIHDDTGTGGKDTGRTPHDSADTDTDSDSDSDSDSDTDEEYEGSDISKLCDEKLPKTAPEGPDCMSGELSCEHEVIATTAGGSSNFLGDDYTHNFCFANVENHDYDATERVYGFNLPAGKMATIQLDSPCLDLDLAVMRWYDDGTCPGDDGYPVCEGDDGDDGASLLLTAWDTDTYWLLVVDGKYDTDVGNFRLLVDCTDG